MEEKSKIVDEMKQYEPTDKCEGQTGTEFGKPEFPDILKQDVIDSLSLPSYAWRDSGALLFILRLETAFLKKSIEDEDSFVWAEEIVDNLAEQGVKLCHDFNTTAEKNTGHHSSCWNNQNVLPNQRKRTASSKNWLSSFRKIYIPI